MNRYTLPISVATATMRTASRWCSANSFNLLCVNQDSVRIRRYIGNPGVAALCPVRSANIRVSPGNGQLRKGAHKR